MTDRLTRNHGSIMRALISVYDKSGIESFARALTDAGWEIISTGGTLRQLEASGIHVTSVAGVTGFPEILDGRVKTLHPAIHGGLLGRPGLESDARQLLEHHITPIDLLIVNLYPFEETISRPDVTREEAIEQIDIGGPAMLRAAAKNHENVLPVVDPSDYAEVLERLQSGTADIVFRRSLAAKVFAHASAYDATVSRYLQAEPDSLSMPQTIVLKGERTQLLRYGENPHQQAAAYRSRSLGGSSGVLGARKLHGKELSFNNLLDADAAWKCVRDVEEPCVAIIKHTIPCGLAEGSTVAEAYARALAGDPVSAFGGIVASSVEIDVSAAERIAETFYEVVIAPGFAAEALDRLRAKKNLRLLQISETLSAKPALDLRVISGGWLLQQEDSSETEEDQWQRISARAPSNSELDDLRFAWRAVRFVKSNAIVLARDRAVVGVGSGQPNRVESVAIAVKRAGQRSQGSVMASDAFFPFADGIEQAARAGVTAVIQPGGSMRDGEVIAAADAAGMAMIATGRRHFRH
ncbi:MAG: bifunctional phosphoribosylaminoimidazolecarboxamide formyltransferase/IMP cyclohydrolase [Thermomicrobiales bacterium]